MRNRKVLLLLLAGILVLYIILPRQQTPAAARSVVVLAAKESIQPYTFIGASQVTTTTVAASLAGDYYPETQLLSGYMATTLVRPGQPLSREDARPPEDFRYWADMGLEIGSFRGMFSELVGGEVKPGHRINVYGYRKGDGVDDYGDLMLVASNILVVGVRTETGEDTRTEPERTPTPSAAGGPLSFGSIAAMTGPQPASVIMVAAEPKVVQKIIEYLGSRNYAAWVTLAPEAGAITTPPPMPTPPGPTPTPAAGAQPTAPPAGGPSPGTLEGRVHMSDREAGLERSVFPNGTASVWAVVQLTYAAPPGPIPIRIDVRLDGSLVFESSFNHPRSGQASYLIMPVGGFANDGKFTTTVYAGSQAFSVPWKTAGGTQLPGTGGDGPASVGN
jgi:hypothetical protein